MITERFRAVSWMNESHPTGVVKPIYGIQTFPLTANSVYSKGPARIWKLQGQIKKNILQKSTDSTFGCILYVFPKDTPMKKKFSYFPGVPTESAESFHQGKKPVFILYRW